MSPDSTLCANPTSCADSQIDSRSREMRLRRMLLAGFVALFVVLLASDFADARRFGGGRSFGSKKSYTNNYSKRTAPDKNTAGDQRQAAPSQQGSLANRGGFGGMIGGMLMGGLLGSMLFGGGMGGGVGILELLLLGFVGFMIFKVVRSRRAAAEAAGAGGGQYAYAGPARSSDPSAGRAGAGGWDALRSESADRPEPAEPAAPTMPAGIDEAEFLEGAKALYARLQASWDRRDLDDIRTFTSPEVYDEIARQAQEDHEPGNTDILMIEARVLESRVDGDQAIISVLYDALLREDSEADRPTQVREVWHIHRDNSAANPEWRLEGIQQLDI